MLLGNCKGFNKPCFKNVYEATGFEPENCYGTLKQLSEGLLGSSKYNLLYVMFLMNKQLEIKWPLLFCCAIFRLYHYISVYLF